MICRGGDRVKTKYPIILAHGIILKDFKYFKAFGKIEKILKSEGCSVYTSKTDGFGTVENNAVQLKAQIIKILQAENAEKVNIIAHSKGGLDSRYAVSCLGMDQYVASLTTVNTPHRGCIFADYLLNKIPAAAKDKVAEGYNSALKVLGDETPDFMAAVTDLTASACQEFNRKVPDCPGIYYQSVGSKLNAASGGRFPLNFSHQLVKYFDGPNDGLVAESSFPWG